mmetsp:Transcript_992/g.3321  ORF Transcript_992/g.3321 Transcript_992/m.3321 type:complete len:137 (+) Transcript_992:491-901(+)
MVGDTEGVAVGDTEGEVVGADVCGDTTDAPSSRATADVPTKRRLDTQAARAHAAEGMAERPVQSRCAERAIITCESAPAIDRFHEPLSAPAPTGIVAAESRPPRRIVATTPAILHSGRDRRLPGLGRQHVQRLSWW